MFQLPEDGVDALLIRQRALIALARDQARGLRGFPDYDSLPNTLTAQSPFDGARIELPTTGPPVDSFTGYQVLGELHRGGQGIVYQAIQKSTHRKVAIKVMKEGPFASTIEKARFDREVQILGQVRHPNIVAIHGTGMAAGHHYFIMDYVEGRPLGDYIAERPRAVAEILELFAKISEAVSAAHVRGIIHRDLKPNNIRIDVRGDPHILDFGLAKSGESETDDSVNTMTGQFVGSLPWASPEQAEGAPSTIDLRTDVYSIGVMLFQMLTGEFPYEVVGPMRTVLDRIINEEPMRPRTLRKDINDEVETIVLKCLDKLPERRYQNAGDLARDLRNYLSGEPIDAKRDSTVYVLRKKLRKHIVTVSVAAAFFVVIVAGLIVSAAGWRNAIVQRDVAEREAETRKQVTELLVQVFDSADPSRTDGNSLTAKELIAQGAAKLEHSLKDQPLVKSTLLLTISEAYQALGLYSDALTHAEASLHLRQENLPRNDLLIAESQDRVGMVFKELGQFENSEGSFRKSLKIRLEQLAGKDVLVAQSFNNLAECYRGFGRPAEAEPYYRESLQIWEKAEPGGRSHAAVLNNLAGCLSSQGKYQHAERLYHQTLIMRRLLFSNAHSEVAQALNNLALCLQVEGKAIEGEPYAREAVAMYKILYEGAHPGTAAALDNLARCLIDQGRIDDAELLVREALAMDTQVFGTENVNTAISKNRLGECLFEKGDISGSEELFRQALNTTQKALGDRHPRVGIALFNIARVLGANGDHTTAESVYREALDIWQARFVGDHIDIAKGLAALGSCLCNQGKFDEGELHCRESMQMRERILGYRDWQIAATVHRLALCKILDEQYVEAQTMLNEALEIHRVLLHADHPHIAANLADLGLVLELTGTLSDAEERYREALAIRRRIGGEVHVETAVLETNLAFLLIEKGRPDEGMLLAEHARNVLQARLSEGHSQLLLANAALGWGLSEQGKFADAEPLLGATCETLAGRVDVPLRRRLTLLKAMVRHYELWNVHEPSPRSAEQAAEFRALHAALEPAD